MAVVQIVEIASIVVFLISFYGLITSKNIIKSIVFTITLETSVIMFFLGIGYSTGILPPIGSQIIPELAADPLPQALMVTAVIIGVCSTAINIVIFITLFRKHGTAMWHEIENKTTEEL